MECFQMLALRSTENALPKAFGKLLAHSTFTHLTKLWSESELPRSGRGEEEKPEQETPTPHKNHESKHKTSHQVTRPLLIPELLVESVSRLATVLDLERPPRLESTD